MAGRSRGNHRPLLPPLLDALAIGFEVPLGWLSVNRKPGFGLWVPAQLFRSQDGFGVC